MFFEYIEYSTPLKYVLKCACVAKCLIRYNWNKILSIKNVYEKIQNGREDFEELNFETESEHQFENLLRLAV